MNEINANTSNNLRSSIKVAYWLYLAGIILPLGGFVGGIIAILNKEAARNTDMECHVSYLTGIFWKYLITLTIGLITAPFIIGNFILIGLWIWYIIKSLKGYMAFNDYKNI